MDLKAIKGYVNTFLDLFKLPGIAVSIIKDGEVALNEGFGHRNIETKERVDPHTLFPAASCTKQFAAVAFSRLVEDNFIDLDMPVKKYLPELELYDSIASQCITARDLLCHRSGLPRHDLCWYNGQLNRDDLFSRLRYFKPNVKFREKFQYSNLMYLAAGCLIEKVTGRKWEEYVTDVILKPLGMGETCFGYNDLLKRDNRALPYRYFNQEIRRLDYKDTDVLSSAGSMNSTLGNLLRWGRYLIDSEYREELRIIDEKRFGDMFNVQVKISESQHVTTDFDALRKITGDCVRNDGYGLGWFISRYRGSRVISHGGSIDGFKSSISFMPDNNMCVVVLCNISRSLIPQILTYMIYDSMLALEPLDWIERLRKVNYPQNPGFQPVHSDTVKYDARDILGSYEEPGYGFATVYAMNDKPCLKYGVLDARISYRGNDRFVVNFAAVNPYFESFIVRFVRNRDDSVRGFYVNFVPEAEDIFFARKK